MLRNKVFLFQLNWKLFLGDDLLFSQNNAEIKSYSPYSNSNTFVTISCLLFLCLRLISIFTGFDMKKKSKKSQANYG